MSGAAIEELRQALARLSGAERRLRGREHNRPGELTHAQLRAISALGREREMTAGQIARSAELQPASVTATLDQLEDAGMIRRARSATDRRVCNVTLTPAGQALLDERLAAWRGQWERAFAEVPEHELALARSVIDRITAIYETAMAPSPSPPRPPA